MARSTQGFSGNRHALLKGDSFRTAAGLLKAPARPPTGDLAEKLEWSNKAFSQFVSEESLRLLRAHPLWMQAHPILLGSWGRGELTLKSDLDLLFCGDEKTVFELVTDLQNQGHRIRYRIPLNANNWAEGVESPDCLALWNAKAETPEALEKLRSQQKFIFTDRKIKRKILLDILKERKARAERFDSIQSFLEPQIKFGPGGLRDLFQGQVILDLFADRFEGQGYETKVFDYYNHFFLTLRQKLQLDGFGDVLVATEQFEIANWFGFREHAEFMRQIQRGLARVHFYSEWVLARAASSRNKLVSVEKTKFRSAADLLTALKKDPGILVQHKVRLSLDQIQYPAKTRGQLLEAILSAKVSDKALQAVFNSRFIDKLCPQMMKLTGYVQHDQYHRFTADAHLLQACREVKRLQATGSQKILGPLQTWKKKLNAQDWKVLAWSALYHDLAKGQKGDHSAIGEKWVQQDLKAFGFSKAFRDEVAWLVKNHLELSVAAFRKNPQAPQTWQDLSDLGLNERRLLRLLLWTAIDIRATNPEAWNEWKAKLLADLVGKVLAGGTKNFLDLRKTLPKGIAGSVIEALDPQLFETFTAKTLKEDLKTALKADQSWSSKLDSQKKLWIRYSQNLDRPGVLSEILEKVYAAGGSIQTALIHSFPESSGRLGVYDWFQVQTSREPVAFLRLLQQLKTSDAQIPKVQFLSIDLVSQSPEEWVLSFRGVDQKGLLLAAAWNLKDLGAQVQSARVHTWGRQIEDLFHIQPLKYQDPQVFIEQLRARLL